MKQMFPEMEAGLTIRVLLKWKREILLNKKKYFATNCPRRIVRDELSATNCPATNCPRWVVRDEVSCDELSAMSCPRRIVLRRIVRDELSATNCPATNCPATNCPRRIVRSPSWRCPYTPSTQKEGRIQVCMCLCLHVCGYMPLHLCMHVCIHDLHIWVRMQIHAY